MHLASIQRSVAGSFGLLLLSVPAFATNYVAIGDSLTAEYDTIPSIPGFPVEATAYADVTVKGWESMSWVEVVSRVQKAQFNFGAVKSLSAPWPIPRLSGYEYNWGIPGIQASQYEDFVTSTVVQNFAYYSLRQTLETQLKSRANRVVIWLGGNELRANYGKLYDGGSSTALINGLIDDLGKIVDFVKKKNSKLQIVIATVPDLGATPSKKAAHPDAAKRARVTAATKAANVRIADLAKKKGIGLADTYGLTDALVRNVPQYFGGVQIQNGKALDNDPRWAFTRDGLHPNTALQIFNARAIATAFNQKYNAAIPLITDSQALTLLGLTPHDPFYQWLESFGFTDKSFVADTDRDGVSQLIEYTFGLDPTKANGDEIDVTIGGPVTGIVGTRSVTVTPDPAVERYVKVNVQYSFNGSTWLDVPTKNVVKKTKGASISVIPLTTGPTFLRLKVATIPPAGSTTSISATLRFE
jgi:hypothetical protein